MILREQHDSANTALLYKQTIGFDLNGQRYLNIGNQQNLRCEVFAETAGIWNIRGMDLRLRSTPQVEEIEAAIAEDREPRQVVFCGLGEATWRLYAMLTVAKHMQQRGIKVILKTDGLANLIHDRDITPDLEGNIDEVMVFMFAQDERTYNHYCHPHHSGAYGAMLDFVKRVRQFVPSVVVTAIEGLPGVDIAQCAVLARQMEVKFQPRKLDSQG